MLAPGFTIDPTASEGLGLINTLDGLPFTPTVGVSPQLSADGDTVLLTIALDAPSLFITLPTSVGVTVTGPDGVEQTLRARFAPGETTATIELDADTFFSTSGSDDFTSITGDIDVELFFPAQAELGNGGVTQTFSVSANLVSGTEGDDDIDGGNGNQELFGGSGEDVVKGNNGNDLVDGGADDDEVDGGNGNDTVLGGSGEDDVFGDNGNDQVFGGDGDDFVDGGNGNDTIGGGDGDDEIFGDNGRDVISGGAGDDTIDSGNGNDTIFGDAGDDEIIAGNGRDVIDLGAGSDTVEGGNGSDDFILSFGNAGDTDTILDFGRSDDLVLDGFGFQTAADVLGAASQVGSNVVILLDEATNQTLILEDFELGDLRTSNIEFANDDNVPDSFESNISGDILALL